MLREAIYMRDVPTETLGDLQKRVGSSPGHVIRTGNDAVSVRIDHAEPSVKVGNTEVPMTETGLEALAAWIEVPKPYLSRVDPHLREYTINHLLKKSASSEGIFRVDEDLGLIEVYQPGQKRIEPGQILEAISPVMPEDSPVREFYANPDEFRLDTFVPEGHSRGIGGDRKIGDITHGGVRVVQNRKKNLAPQVSDWIYRLACTNGMEFKIEESERLDTRGKDIDEILTSIELQAQRAMGRVERRIEAFYALRDEKVERPEQTLYRMQGEHELSPRVIHTVAENVPTILDDDGDTTMFDLVNLLTNHANEPSIARRSGSRLLLERAGGAEVSDHAARCGRCRSRLN